jgi:hypothetical protein
LHGNLNIRHPQIQRATPHTAQQAEAATEAQAEAFQSAFDLAEVATKRDIEELRLTMEVKIMVLPIVKTNKEEV